VQTVYIKAAELSIPGLWTALLSFTAQAVRGIFVYRVDQAFFFEQIFTSRACFPGRPLLK
jgi:hypothetical protein